VTRPDYVRCVRREAETTWCGRTLGSEFHFVDAEHAVCNAVQDRRLLICPACAAALVAVITRGAYTPDDAPSPDPRDDLDAPTQAALDRLYALAMRDRTPDEQREFDALCARLAAQSPWLAAEVWRVRDDE